jgi:hypothetical protein
MGARNDAKDREEVHSYYQGGRMAKQPTKKSKRELLDMKTIKAEKTPNRRKKYPQIPTMRLSAENRTALKRLRDCLELRYEKDMEELKIKDLSVDDALTYLLSVFARSHPQIADIVSIDSRMIKIVRYSEGL